MGGPPLGSAATPVYPYSNTAGSGPSPLAHLLGSRRGPADQLGGDGAHALKIGGQRLALGPSIPVAVVDRLRGETRVGFLRNPRSYFTIDHSCSRGPGFAGGRVLFSSEHGPS